MKRETMKKYDSSCMNIGTEQEARALVEAFHSAGHVLRAAQESSCPEDVDRARNFEPVLSRRTELAWIFGTDDFAVCIVCNDYIGVHGEGISACIYLAHMDLPEARDWVCRYDRIEEENIELF